MAVGLKGKVSYTRNERGASSRESTLFWFVSLFREMRTFVNI